MGICDKQLAKHSYTHDAIRKELDGDFSSALMIYEQGVTTAADPDHDWKGNTPTTDELNLWEDGRIECLTNLTRWADLSEMAKLEADNDVEKLWHSDVEVYRHLYVQATFRETDKWGELTGFLDSAMRDEEKSKWVLKNFGAQVALLSLMRDDYDQAKSFVSLSLKNVLEMWRSLHPLARKGRLRLIQSLQQFKEVQEVIDFVRNEKNFDAMQPLQDLLRRWEARWPRETTSIVLWDNVAFCRSLLLEKLEERFLYRAQLGAQQQQYGMQWPGAASQEGVEGMIAEARVSFWKYCMRAGMKQHNFDVAMSFQKLCSEAEKDWRAIATTDNSVSLLSDLPSLCLAVKLEEKRSWRLELPRDRVAAVCNAIAMVQSRVAGAEALLALVPRNFLVCYRLIAKLYMTLYEFLRESKGHSQAALVDLARSTSVISLPGETPAAYVQACLQASYKNLNSAYNAAAKDSSIEYTAKTYMHMGLFCERMLDENSKRTPESRAKYAVHVIEPILAAMALGARDASDLLPKVLLLLSESRTPLMQAAFEKGVAACPPWMFIRWISFLLSNLSDPWMAERTMPVLTKIARDYPLAIYFPFNLSSDVKFLGKASQKLVEPLREALKFPVLEEFMFHLMLLQHPEHRLGDWLAELKRMRKKKDDGAIAEDWRKFRDLTLDTSNASYGSYNAKFASLYASKILKVVGAEDGRDLSKKGLDERALNDILSKAKELIVHKTTTRKEDLSIYSRYLADYDYTQLKSADRALMEVPGQYSNLVGKPDPESHVRISSFGDKVVVFSFF
jgi:hypothetical protein